MAARSPPAESYLGLQIAGLLRGGQLGDGTGRQTQGLCAALWGRVCDCVLAPGRDAGRQAFSICAFKVVLFFGQWGHSAQNARARTSARLPQFFSLSGYSRPERGLGRGESGVAMGVAGGGAAARPGVTEAQAEKDRRSNSVRLSISIMCFGGTLC